LNFFIMNPSLGTVGADSPGWHHPGIDTRMKLFFCGWI